MAAAQGELGDAAPTQRHWLRSVVYLVSYSDKHPFSQAKKDGWKEEKKPASCQWTHQQIFWNLLQQVFLFKSEASLGECQDTRRARARAHTHARRKRERMRLSHCENQPINYFHTVNRIKPSDCQVEGPESAQIQEGTAARCSIAKEEDRGQLLVGKAGWVNFAFYSLLLDALLVIKVTTVLLSWHSCISRLLDELLTSDNRHISGSVYHCYSVNLTGACITLYHTYIFVISL